MITKVYETTKKTKKEMVKEKRPTYKVEHVTVKGRDGYCGRCHRSYSYGDNRKDPTACPYCVCKDCGDSIMNRKRDSFYGGPIIRCYPCWYKMKNGTYKYIYGIEEYYNHTYPTKPTTEERHIPIEVEVEVEKNVEYEVEEEKKVDDEKYETYINDESMNDNSLLINELKPFKSLSSYFSDKHFHNINNIDISKDIEWYNTESIENTVNTLVRSNEILNTIKVNCISRMKFEEEKVDEEDKDEEYLSYVGYYPSVPAYVQGRPLNMYNYQTEKIPVYKKKKNIYVNLALDSRETLEQYKNRGIIVFSIIKELLKKDYMVNLILLDASFSKENVLIQKMTLNNEDVKTNLCTIYNMLTSIEYYRVMLQDEKVSFLKEKQEYDIWKKGMGFVLKMDDLKKIIHLKSKDLLIGCPEELEIYGMDVEKDYQRSMKKLGLLH